MFVSTECDDHHRRRRRIEKLELLVEMYKTGGAIFDLTIEKQVQDAQIINFRLILKAMF